MKIPERMKRLYTRLEAFGIERPYAIAVALPPGWRDSDTENPAVYSQALGLLARNLNLDLRSLQNEDRPIQWQDCGPTLFKRNSSLSEDVLATARCLAVRAAQVACEALRTPIAAIPGSGAAIRNQIISKGHSCVDFENLADYCWDCGVAVLHVSRFPRGARKPDALAGVFNERPAIVIMKRHKYAAWLLFLLAHEIGHIALGHLTDNKVLVDDRVAPDDSDALEAQANTFAVELLTGKPDIRYQAPYNLNAEALAAQAIKTGLRDGVDPGFVALNYADTKWLTSTSSKVHFAVGNLALAAIEPDANPVRWIHQRMCERLDWAEIGRDSRHFLRSIAEMSAR